jgi:ComF family protein
MVEAIYNHPLRQEINLPEYLIPVPLYVLRLIQRGFNQSTCLGKQLSKTLDIPLLLGKIKKIRPTPQQAKLKMKDRHHNLAGAFSLNFPLPQSDHVAIVDDLMTTGATVNEIAKLLKQHCGTKIVEVWTLMRAV